MGSRTSGETTVIRAEARRREFGADAAQRGNKGEAEGEILLDYIRDVLQAVRTPLEIVVNTSPGEQLLSVRKDNKNSKDNRKERSSLREERRLQHLLCCCEKLLELHR